MKSILFSLLALAPTLAGAQSIADAYALEDLPTPAGVDPQIHGLTTLPDGRIVAAFHRGQIAIFDDTTDEWTIFAEGLLEPLGIHAISDREFLVMQRPELTRLKDTDGDGVADEYLTAFDDFGISGNYHEFAFGPLMAPDGDVYISLNVASNGASIREEIRGAWNPIGLPREDFYKSWTEYKVAAGRMYSRVAYRGWVLKVNPKDGTFEPWASGFRSPNGLGFDAAGNLYVSDNQGDWLGASKLHPVKKGRFHGHPASLIWREGWTQNPLEMSVDDLDALRTPASVLFPQGILANSPTQPILIDSDGAFGPFDGQMLIGEMNRARIVRMGLEEVGGEMQGFGIPFYDDNGLDQGNNRLTWSPDRSSLYVGQTHLSWAGGQGFQKITWKGETPAEVHSISLTKEGFRLTFTEPMDVENLKVGEHFDISSYYFEYHQDYGSPQFDDHEHTVTVKSVSDDGLRVDLALDRMKAGYVYEFHFDQLKTAAGTGLINTLACYTAVNLIE